MNGDLDPLTHLQTHANAQVVIGFVDPRTDFAVNMGALTTTDPLDHPDDEPSRRKPRPT